MKKVTNKELLQRIGSLEEKVQELELTSDVQSSHVSLFKEIIEMFKTIPIGRALINRATNRLKLRYLQQIVLPRRKNQLENLKLDKSIPEGIQKMLSKNVVDLYNKAELAVIHRSYFEQQSAFKVRSIFEKIQRMFTNKKVHHIHIKEGEESHASNH